MWQEDILHQCPFPGCNGAGHTSAKYGMHKVLNGCPLFRNFRRLAIESNRHVQAHTKIAHENMFTVKMVKIIETLMGMVETTDATAEMKSTPAELTIEKRPGMKIADLAGVNQIVQIRMIAAIALAKRTASSGNRSWQALHSCIRQRAT